MCVINIVRIELPLSACSEQAPPTYSSEKSGCLSGHFPTLRNAAEDPGAALVLACDRMCSSLVAIRDDVRAHGLMAVDRSDIGAVITQQKQLEEALRNSSDLLRRGQPDFGRYTGARAAREKRSQRHV